MDPFSYQAYRLANETRRDRKLSRFDLRISAFTRLMMLAFVLIVGSLFIAHISFEAMIAVICVWLAIIVTVAIFVVDAMRSRRRDR
jgi:L-asparagine transporter-like permease